MSSDEALHGPPVAGDDCIVCALKCLHECDPTLKAEYTQIAFQLFQSGLVPCTVSSQQRHGLAPERPGRDPKVNFVDVKDLPKRGRAGSLASRQALLHSLVHIECCAIDLVRRSRNVLKNTPSFSSRRRSLHFLFSSHPILLLSSPLTTLSFFFSPYSSSSSRRCAYTFFL